MFKKITQILLCFGLLAFLLGKPIFEYLEFSKELKDEPSLVFETKGDLLQVKVPFLLPYQSQSIIIENTNELVIFEGSFYRATFKILKRDTLFTTYQKENLTRQNVFELMAQVSQNFDSQKRNDPLKSLVEVLKHISKHYLKTESKYTTYFWNFEPSLAHAFVLIHFQTPNLLLFSPPPKS